jgi:hypothetical protein
MEIIKISDLQVFINILIWFLIMSILLIAITIAGDLQPTYVSLDPYRPANDYYACIPTRPAAFTGVVIAILTYCGLIILVGLFVAYKVRRIPFQVYDESSTISFSMYNVAFFVVVLAALRLSNAASKEVLFVLQSVGLVLCVVITLTSLAFTKVTFILRGDTVMSTSQSSRDVRTSASVRGGSALKSSPSDVDLEAKGDKGAVQAHKDRIIFLESLLRKNKISFPAWGATGSDSKSESSSEDSDSTSS